MGILGGEQGRGEVVSLPRMYLKKKKMLENMSREIETIERRSGFGKESNKNENIIETINLKSNLVELTQLKREFGIQRNNFQRKKHEREKKGWKLPKGL